MPTFFFLYEAQRAGFSLIAPHQPKPLANHRGRLVELATDPGADSAEVPAVRGLPPCKGSVPLALIGSKRRVYGLKRHVPDLDQFDDRYRGAVG